MSEASATVEIRAELSARIRHVPTAEGKMQVTADLYATIGDDEYPAGKVGALVDEQEQSAAEASIRELLARTGIAVTYAEATTQAKFVDAITRQWEVGDFEVLVPDACTDPGPPPTFEATWMMVEAIDRDSVPGETVFIFAGDPPGIRWGVLDDAPVQVRVA